MYDEMKSEDEKIEKIEIEKKQDENNNNNYYLCFINSTTHSNHEVNNISMITLCYLYHL